jgi:hypothetical protein
MAVDLAQLKTELETDPNGYGYAAYIAAGNMQTLADILNQVRTAIVMGRAIILREEAMSCWNLAEVEASYAADPAVLELACNAMHFPSFNMQARDEGSGVYLDSQVFAFAQEIGDLTSTAMNNITVRSGSRAEELWAAGDIVTWYQCSQALNSTVLI